MKFEKNHFYDLIKFDPNDHYGYGEEEGPEIIKGCKFVGKSRVFGKNGNGAGRTIYKFKKWNKDSARNDLIEISQKDFKDYSFVHRGKPVYKTLEA